MNRFVQKLIAGAAAVAIVVTGLVGGAPVAKADPTYSITINKQSTDAADHEFNGWQLAELKDVVVNNDKSIAYTIDTNEKLVSTIEAAMDFNAVIDKTGNAQNVLTAYKQDKNYYVSDGNSSNNPMGFLIMHVFSNTGTPNLSSPWNNDAALRTFAQNLEDQTFPEASTATPFTTATNNNANVKTFKVPGIWFLKDATSPAADKESFSLPIITPTSIPDTDIDGAVTVKNVIPNISKHLANADGTYNNEPSFSVGDTVYYTLETTVPYYTGYSTGRVFKINDTASSAISSFVDDAPKGVNVVSVKVGDVTLKADTDYSVSYAATTDIDEKYANGVDTVIDLGKYVNQSEGATKLDEGAKVTVLVSATLDADAKLSDSTDIKGNPNKDSLTWSHNPNNTSDEQTIPGDEVNVYSYKFNILKTAKDMTTKLRGAKFTIKAGDSYLGYENGAWKTLPAAPKDTQAGAEAGVFATKADGVIDFNGLDAGTYEIEEIVPPNGYTALSLPKFNFTVSATVNANNPEGQKTIIAVSYAKGTNDNDSRVSVENSTIKIWNAKNLTELPLTGDLGIKVFITVGVLLMAAGAAFALSARMRA
ncbi:SpaA isopeptide-forming pilin-related protein [Collinsella aerofaciens]|uniref:SpaA isopeptide-forming pilin-related protein n=1 Tax=Collinsella aerofaciens TaxID=74426 RepID=UPI00321A1FCF